MMYWIVFLRELLKYLHLKVFCMEWLFWVLKFPIISWKPCNSAKARQSRFTHWFSIPVVSRASCTLLQITLCLWWLTNCRRKPSWFLMASSTFELLLVRLDIQQESDRHTDVLDAITKHLGIGSYREWSEEHRQEWLLTVLSGKRPLFGPDLPKTEEIAAYLTPVMSLQNFLQTMLVLI